MAISLEKLYAKFRDVEESLTRLRQFAAMGREEFLVDRDSQDIASFRLIVATEAAIDICLHLAAKFLKKVPEEYAGCFQLLAEHDLIDKDLAARLALMARFRNLLIHRYWRIDYGQIYEIITGPDLDDLKEFMQEVGRMLERGR